MSTEPETGTAALSSGRDAAWPPAWAAGFSATVDPLQHAAYRRIVEKHLNHQASNLFSEFTGVHFRVVWSPVSAGFMKPRDWPPRSSACCVLARESGGTHGCCEGCIWRQLARAARAGARGLLFTCGLGVHNYWLPIRLREVVVGAAYVRALDGDRATRFQQAQSLRSTPAATKHPCRKAGLVTRSQFGRAARLLRFIVDHAQAWSLADLRMADLNKARLGLLDFEKTNQRMRRELELLSPAIHHSVLKAGAGSHASQILHHVLEAIHENYMRPITLRQSALALKLNTTYLSSLFSRGVGVPFKAYLTAVRLEKAQQLLSDPVHSIAEVAAAVGYSSENRFRIAFKKLTGLCPRVWRETLRTETPSAQPPRV